MKKIVILISLVLLISLSYAWDLQRQAQFPTNFYTLDRVGNTVWAGGLGGGFAKSTDNGVTWNFLPSPCYDAVNAVYKDVLDVDFYDANHGMLVSDAGLVAITADGGATWNIAAQPAAIFGTSGVLGCVYLPDGKMWAVGWDGKIAYSTDNGANWVAQTSGMTDQIYSISMNAAGTGFCALNNGLADLSKILKTTDFGATWTIINLTITNNPTFQEVKQIGSSVLLVGTGGYIGVSNDNGVTWNHHPGAGGTIGMHDICLNGQIGYAVGWNSTVVKTTDGWATYQLVTNDYGKYFEQINILDNGTLLIAGWTGSIASSTDQGVSWTERIVNAVDIYSASAVNETTWYMAGDKGEIIKTTNGGASFTTLHIPNDASTYYACYFKTALEGWVTGKTTGKIFHTTDGGLTWTTFTVPAVSSAKSYYEIFFTSPTNGYAVGVPNKSARTTDGGLTWTAMADAGLTTNNNLFCVFFKSDSLGFAGANTGQVFITTNACASWTPIVVGSATAYIRDIWFKDAQHGVLVNSMGDIYYTSNGGMTAADWTAGTEQCLDDMNGVWADADGIFWAAGFSSDNTSTNIGNSWALVKSVNNGATWTQETFPALTFNPTRFMGITGATGKLVAYGKNNVELSQDNGGTTPTFATNLFFSEYVEGTSNNKALEIFNGTGATVDLTQYSVKLAANGLAWSTTLNLTGTLANNDVFVIANAGANAAIMAVTDITSIVTYYNGNDAVGLFQGTELIDTIGQELDNPGTVGWPVAGVANALLDHTIIRKDTIISPTTDWVASAGTDVDNSEWDVHPVNYIDNLGSHVFNPGGTTTPHVAVPTFNPPAGIYSTPINVTIATTTPNATIYYTTDGSTPTTASNVYAGPVPVAVTTTLKAMATATDFLPSPVATGNYVFPVTFATLAALRAAPADGTTIYQVTGQVVLTFKQTFRSQKYLQDATAGILVDDLANLVTTVYNVGDGLTGITGKMSEFGGMLQFVPISNWNAATSTGNVITPQVITLTELSTNFESYESELVKVLNCSFTAPTGNFANGIVYPINDGTADYNFRTSFYDVNYIGDPVPTIPMHIVGIPNSRVDGNYLTSRDSLDIIVPAGGVAAPTFNPPAGMYYSPFTVTLSCATTGTQIHFTTDGTTPTATSTLFTDPIPVNANTTIKAIAIGGTQFSPVATAVYTFPVSIADVATLRQQTAGTTIYRLAGEVILTFQQTYRHQKFIQDATAGIMIDDNLAVITTAYNVGDGITGISGTLTEFGGVLEFIPVANPGAATSTGNLIVPVPVTYQQFLNNFETYESRVVSLGLSTFNTTQTSFANGIVYPISNGTDTINFRTTFYDVDYVGTTIPTTPVYLVGIPNSRTDGIYFTSRNLADMSPFALDAPELLSFTIFELNDVVLTWAPGPIPVQGNGTREWENLTALKVYRNNVLIATITDFVVEEMATYTDVDVPVGNYVYYVTNVYSNLYESAPSNEVNVSITGVDDPILPATMTALTGNYPNPFNPSTTITYSVKNPGDVNITIYNLKGQKVKTLVNAHKGNGQYKATWNGTDDKGNTVSSGIYLYRMQTGKYDAIKRMLLTK